MSAAATVVRLRGSASLPPLVWPADEMQPILAELRDATAALAGARSQAADASPGECGSPSVTKYAAVGEHEARCATLRSKACSSFAEANGWEVRRSSLPARIFGVTRAELLQLGEAGQFNIYRERDGQQERLAKLPKASPILASVRLRDTARAVEALVAWRASNAAPASVAPIIVLTPESILNELDIRRRRLHRRAPFTATPNR